MEIRIDPHTLERAVERGATEEEVGEVVIKGFPILGKYGRKGRAKIYAFHRERNGKYYEQKRVEVFYTIEGEVLTSVTVYVFYGKWEG